MISVEQAKQIIFDNTVSLPVEQLALNDAVGRYLSTDIFSPIDSPPFLQSAMDGYAILYKDYLQQRNFTVINIIAAGDATENIIRSQEASRIFTGAKLPAGTDTVVMQEKTSIINDTLIIEDDALEQGSNARPAGSEIGKGELAMPANTKLSPGSIGYLAAMGLTTVNVYQKPTISIVITGNELQQPGKALEGSLVYESNSYSLQAVLKKHDINVANVYYATDDIGEIRLVINKALQTSDMLLITGGVSVGDYDFVKAALAAEGVEVAFHKVLQKPGKPLLYGKKNAVAVFGLPGNPASVLTCVYQYVLPCIAYLKGERKLVKHTCQLPLVNSYAKKTSLTHFLKGAIADGGVLALTAQESYKMKAFAEADCIIEIGADIETIHAGTLVPVYLIQ